MQSIERYGVVALLFLVVTVIAVLVWDDSALSTAKTKIAHASEKLESMPAPGRSKSKTDVTPDGGKRVSMTSPAIRRSARGKGLDRELLNQSAQAEDGLEPGQVPSAGIVPAGSEVSGERRAQQRNAHAETVALAAEQDPTPKVRRLSRAGEGVAQGRKTTRTYEVRPGDTLSEIAMEKLGTVKRLGEIIALNPGLNPDRLIVGKKIELPAADASAAAKKPAVTPAPEAPDAPEAPKGGDVHRVREGESLWKIAQLALGDGARWNEIAKLNPAIDPDRLKVGMQLTLPIGASLDARSTAPVSAPLERVAASTQPPKRGRVR